MPIVSPANTGDVLRSRTTASKTSPHISSKLRMKPSTGMPTWMHSGTTLRRHQQTMDDIMQREPLAVCFSGGGFRAMLFHLGVVRALRDAGLLSVDVIRNIFSVSGGSILAAHLVLNWDRYTADKENTFRECAMELIRFAQSDVRGRILRRWLTLGLLPFYGRTRQLARFYDRLYGGALLASLSASDRPQLHILATNMISGQACFFSSSGITRIAGAQTMPTLSASALRIGDAVAASSAFPPMFPPLRLTAKKQGWNEADAPSEMRLTDGGVFDNTGVRAARIVLPDSSLFISDASAGFDQATIRSFTFIVPRAIRATDILMSRVAELEEHAARPATPVTGRIGDIVAPADVARVNRSPALDLQSLPFQQWVKNVRTDLDRFDDDVIRAVYRHGYEVGLRMVGELRPSDQFVVTKAYWDPCSAANEAQDRSSATENRKKQSIVALLRRTLKAIGTSAPAGIDKSAVAKVARAASRSSGLWNARDPACWFFVVLLLAVAGLVLKYCYWDPRHTTGWTAEKWSAFDPGSQAGIALRTRLEETGFPRVIETLTNEARAGGDVRLALLVALSPPFTGSSSYLRICSKAVDRSYKTAQQAVLLTEVNGTTYARTVAVGQTDLNELQVALENPPKGGRIALIVAIKTTLDPSTALTQLTPDLIEWRICP